MNTVGNDGKTQVGRTNNCVAHLLFGWMILIMIASCSNADREIDATSDDYSRKSISSVLHIDDIFTLEREVVLTDSIFIAHHTYLDVDTDGDFLLTDLFGQQVVLFDRNGHHKKTLSTELCDPGFPWSPFQARFKPDQNIIVNSSEWGYEFSNEGNCIGVMHDEFGFPYAMGFNDKGHIYGFYVHGQEGRGYHIRKMNQRGKPIDKFGYNDKYFWYTMRNFALPDIIIDRNNYVYHAKVFSSQIDKYDKQGDFVVKIEKRPDYYKELKVNDSEFAMGNDARSASQESSGKFSYTRQLFLLNDRTIMIRYDNEYKKDPNEKFGLGFMDLEGNKFFDMDILTHIKFISAKDGLAYSFFDSTNRSKGYIGEPSIKIYRYLPPAQ